MIDLLYYRTHNFRLFRVLLGIYAFTAAEVHKYYGLDSCIGATKVVLIVLKHFGFRAKPQSVQLIVRNSAFNKAVISGDTPPP